MSYPQLHANHESGPMLYKRLLGAVLRTAAQLRFQYEPNNVSNAAKTYWLCTDKFVTAFVNPFEGKAAKTAVSSTTFSFETVLQPSLPDLGAGKHQI
jgi:hypothetical protein